MLRRAWAITLAALMLFPLAAASSEGSFLLRGSLSFASPAGTESPLLALFVADASRLDTLRVEVSRATVFEYRVTFHGAENMPRVQVSPTQERTWTLTDAVIRMVPQGDHEGYLGVYPGPDALLTTTASREMEPRSLSEIGTKSTDGEAPENVNYYRKVVGPHFRHHGQGSATSRGVGGVKIAGPDMEITTPETRTTHATGLTRTSPAEETRTWLYVRFDAPATLLLEGAPYEAATAETRAVWDGSVRFAPTSGNLRHDGRIYEPAGVSTQLEGAFTADLVPLREGEARMTLAGELRSTSMSYAPAPAPVDATRSFPWVALLVAAAVVAMGGGAMTAGVLSALRRKEPTASVLPNPFPFSAEDCMQASDRCADVEDWARALEWAERARRLAPTSGEAAGQVAWALEKLGDAAGAYAAYAEASRLLPSEADYAFLAARQARELPERAHEVEDFLKLALERDPGHAFDVEQEFPELARRPEWRRILQEATARADDESEA